MRALLAEHDDVLRRLIDKHRGHLFKHTGDGVAAVFASPSDAVAAAVGAQALLLEVLPVRMGLHTGEAEFRDGDYFGSTLNRCARLMGVAHGGQLLMSEAVEALVPGSLPDNVTLADLGEHRLRDLARPMHVFQVVHPSLVRDFPVLVSLDASPGNLPLRVSSFVGREREIERTVDALGEARVVTLTGVGGVGKTRLALQVAAEVLPGFRDGVWLIELASVRDPDDVIDAFAATLGVTARAGQTLEESLTEFLRTKQLLLVVDNCEHVLDAVADLVEEIVGTCERVVVLATSREGLALDGERLLAVPALSVPDVDADLAAVGASDAVQLFVERGRAADADFALSAANAPAVGQVCRRLDGVPLAIELAAARVTSMSPAELAAALDRRFDVLAGGRRRAVKRQQTLRATIDWSYDLLDESEQLLLARLAVFAGGCTREAAEAICAGGPIDGRAVLGLLTSLVARSLVVAERGGLDTRYRLLETIREYGEERLVEHRETDSLRERHARYYADLALRSYEPLWGPGQLEWGARLAADAENVVAAFAHAVDANDLDLAVTLLDSTCFHGNQIGYWLRLPFEPVLAIPGVEQHPGYPLVLMAAAFASDMRGEAHRALEYGDGALAAEQATTDPRPYARDLIATRSILGGFIATSTGAFDEAADAYLDGAERLRRAGRLGEASNWLSAAAAVLCLGGRFDDAAPVATDGLAVARTHGAPTSITNNLINIAEALSRREPERARVLLDEAAHRDLDYESYGGLAHMTVAAAMVRDWPLAARVATRSIPHIHWINHRPYLHGILTISARALAVTDPEAAATIQGAAHTLMMTDTPTTAPAVASQTEAPGEPANGPNLFVETRRETTGILVELIGRERLHELRERGVTMDTDSAVTYTLSRLDAYLTDTDET